MKKLHLFAVLALLLISCWCSSCKDDVKGFIPGIYYAAFKDSIYENTYTKGFDTLRIAAPNGAGSETFQVERSLHFTRTVDGKTQSPVVQHNTWTGSYQASDKVLYIRSTNKTIVFDVKNKKAKIDSNEYIKLE